MSKRKKSGGLLRRLGIVGYDGIEPVVVAALAEECPLLLIGEHGTAKSLLLNRVGEALGLVHRHYNASLLNFDDLAGYPYPNADRSSLEYIHTPSTVWEAGSVFFDEISRCRPDLQNKLFPIIHERMVQGLPLTNLRHRWAAMNPPATDDGDGDAFVYGGSETLDPALADRFAFVVRVPGLDDLRKADQAAVLKGAAESPEPGAGPALRSAVATAKSLLLPAAASLGDVAAEYVQVLAGKLAGAGLRVSPRRGRQVVRNIAAVHAARLALGEEAPDVHGDAWTALRCSLPHPAYGVPVDEAKLLAVHRSAWELVKLEPADPTRLILTEPDPLKRIELAIGFRLEPVRLSTIVLDTLAGLAPWEARALSTALFPAVADEEMLTAVAVDALAERAGAALCLESGTRFVRRNQSDAWRELVDTIARVGPQEPGGGLLHNLAMSLFKDDVPFVPSGLVDYWRRLVAAFWKAGEPAGRADA